MGLASMKTSNVIATMTAMIKVTKKVALSFDKFYPKLPLLLIVSTMHFAFVSGLPSAIWGFAICFKFGKGHVFVRNKECVSPRPNLDKQPR